MLMLFFSGLVVYSAIVSWPWWIATMIGGVSGVLQTVTRTMQSPLNSRVEEGELSAFQLYAPQVLIGLFAGGLWTTGAYFIVRWITGLFVR
jgi:hypothetical protein